MTADDGGRGFLPKMTSFLQPLNFHNCAISELKLI